jgi:SPP1 gp7 family putative phage head morphogenesis protein
VWLSGIRRLFLRQLTTSLARLRTRWARWLRDPKAVNPDEVFDPAFQRQATSDALTGLFEALFAASGARVAAQHGFAFNVSEPKVMALIEMRVSKLAEQVTTTTYDDIKSVILTGVASGSSIPEVSKGIEAVFAEADSTRATMIARTETIAAAADGALASYRQAVDSGALDGYGKTWIATPDERECPVCQSLDGEQRAFDQPFSDGQEGPPDHVNCRCAIGAEPLDPSDRSLHADDVRTILRAIGDGSLTVRELVA